VIPRLYATGVSTASVMGRAYPGAGSSIGPSLVWGYVAARHAANVRKTSEASRPGKVEETRPSPVPRWVGEPSQQGPPQ
jgi:succinate dehydrogenase/fumarate reductase flavoprotein subunit